MYAMWLALMPTTVASSGWVIRAPSRASLTNDLSVLLAIFCGPPRYGSQVRRKPRSKTGRQWVFERRMRKLLRAIAGCFFAHPSERFPAILDEVTPASVSAIRIPASSVLVNPTLPHTGARSVIRSKGLFVAVRATLEDSGFFLHQDRLSSHSILAAFPGLDLAVYISQRASLRSSGLMGCIQLERNFCLDPKGGGTNVLKSPSSFSPPSAFSSSQTTRFLPSGVRPPPRSLGAAALGAAVVFFVGADFALRAAQYSLIAAACRFLPAGVMPPTPRRDSFRTSTLSRSSQTNSFEQSADGSSDSILFALQLCNDSIEAQSWSPLAVGSYLFKLAGIREGFSQGSL